MNIYSQMETKAYKFYEGMVIIGENSAITLQDAIDECCGIIEQQQGKIASVENWGMRDLSYKIGSCKRGFYFLVRFAAEPSAIHEVDRIFKIKSHILRFMICKISKKELIQSIIANTGG